MRNQTPKAEIWFIMNWHKLNGLENCKISWSLNRIVLKMKMHQTWISCSPLNINYKKIEKDSWIQSKSKSLAVFQRSISKENFWSCLHKIATQVPTSSRPILLHPFLNLCQVWVMMLSKRVPSFQYFLFSLLSVRHVAPKWSNRHPRAVLGSSAVCSGGACCL